MENKKAYLRPAVWTKDILYEERFCQSTEPFHDGDPGIWGDDDPNL